MIKGKVVKDEDDLTKFALKNGITLMLMGTAEEQGLREPAKPVIFDEDLSPRTRARMLNERSALVIPAGLMNLGNTCYMNATFQCLKRVNELKEALKSMQPPQQEGNIDGHDLLTLASGETMRGLE